MTARRYGWRGPGPADWSAKVYAAPHFVPPVDHVDRLSLNIPIRDQGQESSCTGFGSTRAVRISTGCAPLSEQFAYFGGCLRGGTETIDGGAIIADVYSAAAEYGMASDASYPYVVGQFAQRPPFDAFSDAKNHGPKFTAPRVVTIAQIKTALASKQGVTIGFSVPQFFEEAQFARDGWLRMPTSNDRFVGGHAVCVDGYDDRPTSGTEPFLWIANSYGPGFALGGWFQMPQRWVTDPRWLCDDGHAVVPA